MTDYQKYINALRKCAKERESDITFTGHIIVSDLCRDTANLLDELEQEPRWIPVSERLPNNTDPVNITWVNHNPESYYADIKDKPFTATGHYCNGRWWWYSASCQDYLDEYGHSDVDVMDDAIEVIAWQPLPEPYKAESEEANQAS